MTVYCHCYYIIIIMHWKQGPYTVFVFYLCSPAWQAPFLSFPFQWSALISIALVEHNCSLRGRRVRVCECVFACWRGSERECDWLHLTVYDPYCCLLLYIIPASRIGHDLNKATSVHTIFSIMFLLSISTRLTAVKQGTSVSCLNVETIPSRFMVT